jgi:hypothetical protein
MTFDWLEYLNLAQELAGDAASSPNEEAKKLVEDLQIDACVKNKGGGMK